MKSVETETEAGGDRADRPFARDSLEDPVLIRLNS